MTKVSDMARHAGEAWRAIQPDKRAEYEKMSADNKVPLLLPWSALHFIRADPEWTSVTNVQQVPSRYVRQYCIQLLFCRLKTLRDP